MIEVRLVAAIRPAPVRIHISGHALSLDPELAIHPHLDVEDGSKWVICHRRTGYCISRRRLSREQAESLLPRLEAIAPWRRLTAADPDKPFAGWREDELAAAREAVRKVFDEMETMA